jgi:hypothetical protein
MSLDQKVAQALYRAHQIERALHDPGPWFIEVGPFPDQRVPARRVVGDDHVAFYAVVPLTEQEAMTGTRAVAAELHCRDDLVACKLLTPVGGLAEVCWGFRVIDPEQAAI